MVSKSQNPARKRGKWTIRRRIKIKPIGIKGHAGAGDAGGTANKQTVIVRKLEHVVPLLWASDYEAIMAQEKVELEQLGVLNKAIDVQRAAPLSSYKARNKSRHPERTATQALEQAGTMSAMAVRLGNQQSYPFSTCARSIATLMNRMDVKDFKELVQRREVLSRPTASGRRGVPSLLRAWETVQCNSLVHIQ